MKTHATLFTLFIAVFLLLNAGRANSQNVNLELFIDPQPNSVSIGAYQWKNPMLVNQIDSVDWEIFENQTSYDFNTLKTTHALPDLVVKLVSLNTPDHSTTLDHFASRIRGYIIPPYDGNYSFYFACDNAGQFWLSTDTSSANAQLKSNILSIQTDWTRNISTQTLIAGQKYFFEILHYDTTFTDQIKLGWKIPGDTIPAVISTPYIVSSGDNIQASTFSLLDHEILAYPVWDITPRYNLTPWNAANKNITWRSSNTAIATINALGVIHTIAPGICRIVGTVAGNTALADSLVLNVTDYYGPYFVKQIASPGANGHSWDAAISLPLLLETLKQGALTQKITIYASEGTYKPTATIDRNKTFTVNNIRLVGGFSGSVSGTDTINRDFQNHETILSGEIGVAGETLDNSYHVVVASGSAVIDGFTIRDGRASCSTYGYTPGYYTYKNDDNGGGVLIPQTKSNVVIINCKVINNSAWNSGAGMCCTRSSININQASVLSVLNSSVNDNTIQQTYISTGGIFIIQVNGQGGGISMITATLNTTNSKYFNNTASGYGKAIYLEGARANVDRCSVYKNIGDYEDLWAMTGSTYNIDNSTIAGRLVSFFICTVNLKNSTISGGGYVGGSGNYINIDNSIWSGVSLSQIPDPNLVTVKYSILGSSLYGSSKNDVISTTVAAASAWLDSIAYNGGLTPTMKLKTVPNNPAKSKGNPLYLNTADQRGEIRSDSVSIGAYQWVRPANISILPQQITLCQGDSISFAVTIVPDLVNDGSYTKTSTNNSIARVTGSKIYAVAPGNVDIIVRSTEGGRADTCKVTVTGIVGTGTITGTATVTQGNTGITYSVPAIDNASSYVWAYTGSNSTINGTGASITIDYAANATGGNLTVYGVNACGSGTISAEYPIVVNTIPAALTWEGGTSESWTDPGNWLEAGIPGASTNVTIPSGKTHYPTLTAAAVCNNITVKWGASLKDNGNLTLSTNAKITVEHPAFSTGQWSYISSPVAGVTSTMFYGNFLYDFNTSTNTYTPVLSTATPLTAMKGFALYPKTAPFTAAFVGDLNKESSYSITTVSGSGQGWYLIGNPFPSAIDWDQVDKSGIDDAVYIYLYGPSAAAHWSAYVDGTGSGGGSNIIAPTQGFFVKGTGGNFVLDNSDRVHAAGSVFKKANGVVPNLLRIEVSGNGYKDDAVVRFKPEATPEFDGEFDALKRYGDVAAAAQLYTLGSIPLAINTLPAVNDVPVGIVIGKSGSYTIAATEINDLGNTTLDDTELGISTDLSAGPYTFDAVAGTFDQRFILHFTMLGLTPTKNVEAAIYSYQRTVHINMKDQVKGDIFIYNISGQQVASKLAAQGTNEIKLTGTGNYIVKVISKNSTIVRKVFILQ